MTLPTATRSPSPHDTPETRAALERLLARATQPDAGGRYVANFLLAWWNAPACGGVDLTDLWLIDDAGRHDIATVLPWIASAKSYPDQLGYGQAFRAVLQTHRSRAPRRHAVATLAAV